VEFAAPGGEVNDVFCSVPGLECGSRSMAVHSGFLRLRGRSRTCAGHILLQRWTPEGAPLA